MGIEDTITEFAEIWHSVYADSTPDRTKRTERLENVIKGLLKRKGFSETRKMYVEDAIESPCKVYVFEPALDIGANHCVASFVHPPNRM